jgi:hypothetical protein
MAVMGSEIQFKGYEQRQGQLFPALSVLNIRPC